MVAPEITPAGLRPSIVVVKVPVPEPVQAAWSIERGDGAVRSAHEAMIHVAVVIVLSRNLACRIDVKGEGALAKTRYSARHIERGQGAVGSAQEAVDVAADTVVTRDCRG